MPDTTQALAQAAPQVAAIEPQAQTQIAATEQQVQPAEKPGFKWQFPTGSVYADDNALTQGVVEKDMTIARLKAELMAQRTGHIQSRVQPQGQVIQGPDPRVQAEFSELVRSFPQTEHADLQAMAEYNVKHQDRIRKSILSEVQGVTRSQQWDSQYESFKAAEIKNGVNLDFDPTYDAVFQEFQGQSPEVHYAVWKARKAASGSNVQANASTTAAAGMYQRAMDTAGSGTGPVPVAANSNHPYVQQQVQQAIKSGRSPESVERVRQRAMENLPAVIKTGAQF